jgi:putative restriction endonuclease
MKTTAVALGHLGTVYGRLTKSGGGAWPFWNKVLDVREGDTVIHLRGVPPDAYFVGYSVASGDGFQTTKRPPNPGEWGYASAFYRADLRGFTPFHQPINLADVFSLRRIELEAYFDTNRNAGANKANVFFVRQSGRLQCQNGAYLSDVEEGLLTALFGNGLEIVTPSTSQIVVSVETGSQISTVRTRLGQALFSNAIKRLYGNRCCFPGCTVSDPRFLVGSHIARWADNESLRGNLGNGLCLCLIHDRAFEIGLFTLDQQFRVFVNPRERQSQSGVMEQLLAHHEAPILSASVKPLDDALLEHWIRVDIEP